MSIPTSFCALGAPLDSFGTLEMGRAFSAAPGGTVVFFCTLGRGSLTAHNSLNKRVLYGERPERDSGENSDFEV